MKRDPSLIRLSRDHHRGLALALRIERELPNLDASRLRTLIVDVQDFWKAGLLPHFRAECECLLARLARRSTPGDELIGRTQRDHLRINALLVELGESDESEEQRRVLAETASLLREHIRWEEAVLFEAAQSLLASADLRRLAEDLAQRLPEIPPPPAWSSD